MVQEEEFLVKITNLQKIYDSRVYALTGVTAELKRGEIVALLGENGAGKSTLINILIGALAKTRGEAVIDGVHVDEDIRHIRKVIGVCPQFDILWEELTAGQHL
jgi:ABC-type multidrug transport system ATPase subunit